MGSSLVMELQETILYQVATIVLENFLKSRTYQ